MADSKVSNLPTGVPASGDLVYFVVDPTGTPESRATPVDNFSLVLSGDGPPSTPPTVKGAAYIDNLTKYLYVSTGTSAVNDWYLIRIEDAIDNHAAPSSDVAHAARYIQYSDLNDELEAEDVESAIAEVYSLAIASDNPTQTVGVLSDVSGATFLNLGASSTFWVQSATGPFTLNLQNTPSGDAEIEVIFDTDVAPTWFPGINWLTPMSGIPWNGERVIVRFSTLNGVDWLGTHVNPLPPITTEVYTIQCEEGTSFADAYVFPLKSHDVYTRKVEFVDIDLADAPVNQPIIWDGEIAGTTMFTTPSNRPQVGVGQTNVKVTNIENPYWAPGEELTLPLVQEDSPVVASSATITVGWRQADEPEVVVPNPDMVAVVSTMSNRTSPVPLESVTGAVAIHLSNNDPEIDRVMFFMDTTESVNQLITWVTDLTNPEPTDPGYIRGDSTPPYDMLGGTAGAANMWLSTTDPTGNARPEFNLDGAHVLSVAVRYVDGSGAVYTFNFTVNNGVSSSVFPAVPTGLTAEAASDFQAQWSWDANATGVGGFDDATGYEIRFGTSNPPEGAPVINTNLDRTYTAVGLTGGDSLYYAQVRAYDADGDRSDWSSAVSFTVTGDQSGLEAVNVSRSNGPDFNIRFGPAGDGVTPNHNALIFGMHKGPTLTEAAPYQISQGEEAEIDYPVSASWSSPKKVNTQFATNAASNIDKPNKTGDALGVWYSRGILEGRIRVGQHPDNGGPGPRVSVNYVIAQRKHNAKTWNPVKGGDGGNAIVGYTKSKLLTARLALLEDPPRVLGHTPQLPDDTTYAEDSVVAVGLAASGDLDSRLQALAIELVDNQTEIPGVDDGPPDPGTWVDRYYMRWGWEIEGAWSADCISINPNNINSTILQKVANGDYGVPLTQQVRDMIGAITDPGSPKIEVFSPNAAFDGIPGYHQILVGSSNPDVGTGGDSIPLRAAAYNRINEVLNNEIADRCAFHGVPARPAIMFPNHAHPGADPESESDGDGVAGMPWGWHGTGSAPDGGDLNQPYELARVVDLRFTDLIGRDRFAMIDMDFYIRNALLEDPDTEIPHLYDLLRQMALRYRRPVSSSECGFTARGNKNTATINTENLAKALDQFFNPTTGLWAMLPTSNVVHYIPDGNNEGRDRYRLKKNLDDVGADTIGVNPWYTMTQHFPGRTNPLSVGDLAFLPIPS